MSIVAMPANLRCGRGCKVEQITTDAVGASDPAGNTQARAYGVPRWALSLVSPSVLTDAEAGVWKAMLLATRGSLNFVAAYDPSRPVPKGTLRGALTLLAGVAYGDNTATLDCGAGQAGRTVKVGDWLQFGAGKGSSQLVIVTADAVVDGASHLALTFESPARMAFAAGTAVTWDHPVAYYRRPPGRVGWTPYSSRHTEAMAVDLVESW